MKIYLAARYSRRIELCGYRESLRLAGFEVEARWLDGNHQIGTDGAPVGDHGEKLVQGDDESTHVAAAELRSLFANEDFADVMACDMLIAFTEPPRSGHSRGGRHVELGIALGTMKRVWIVGPRENIFCWLDSVKHFDDFGAALSALVGERR